VLEVGLSGLLLDSPHTGTAAYTRNLVTALPGVAPEFRYRLFIRNATQAFENVTVEQLRTPAARLHDSTAVGARVDKLLWETAVLPAAALRRGEGVLHSLHFAAPVLSPTPVVVTVHDLILLALPGYYRSRWAQVYARLMTWTAQRAAAIVTVSEHARADVLRLLRVPEERVFVTPEAADAHCTPIAQSNEREQLQARYGLPDRFVLYLGGAERRKNLETLIRAWAAVAPVMAREEVRLVIVGAFPRPDRLYPDTPGLVRALGTQNTVQLIPAVAEADKPALYRLALLFCFPSTYEGFGLTPLEAMACGTPVIVANATSIPEVVGDAGRLLPARDVQAWADTIRSLVQCAREREVLRERGLARAATFSWNRTAIQTADVYRWVLAR
jgi:glycosyltransferase involved in cell wall biosynthesis